MISYHIVSSSYPVILDAARSRVLPPSCPFSMLMSAEDHKHDLYRRKSLHLEKTEDDAKIEFGCGETKLERALRHLQIALIYESSDFRDPQQPLR